MQNRREENQQKVQAKNIFIIQAQSDGQRVDNFLLKTLKDISKSNIYKLLRKGQIRANGKRIKPLYRLIAGDKIRIPPFLIADEGGELYISEALLQQVKTAILFENNNFVVVNKPSGLAVHSGTGVRVGLIEICKRLFKDDDIQLAHRLDRETSGCVVLAKNRLALNDFNSQSKSNSIIKKYSALVKGVIEDDFIVELSLDTSNRMNGERTVTVSESGKWAKTKFVVLQKFSTTVHATLLQCQLFSGRTHQIRVHTSATNNPIAGDQRYGEAKFNKKLKAMGLKRLFLHASSIEFLDMQREIKVKAVLPLKLQSVLVNLNPNEMRN